MIDMASIKSQFEANDGQLAFEALWDRLSKPNKVAVQMLGSYQSRAESIMKFDFVLSLVPNANPLVVAACLGLHYSGKKTKSGHSLFVAGYWPANVFTHSEIDAARHIGALCYPSRTFG